jgi:hypothetical protein
MGVGELTKGGRLLESSHLLENKLKTIDWTRVFGNLLQSITSRVLVAGEERP